jgi:hypothetical protein
LAGTTTETSASLDSLLDSLTGACPMCACSHHAKPGVTPTTSPADRPPKAP